MTEYFKLASCDGIHKLNCKLYVPSGQPKGILQLVHGMTEHIERYDSFLTLLCDNGYICVTHDHLGHGKSVNSDNELGFIKEKDGWLCLIKDIHKVTLHINNLNPNLPVFLLGHSMGSFAVRLYAEMYGSDIDALIVMGTGGPNPAAKAGLALTKLLIKLKGKRFVSSFIYSMAFGSYNKKFNESSPYAWLTNDSQVIEKYAADKYCSFKFCVSAMHDLITLNSKSNSKKHFKAFPKDLPVLLVSGDMDPVGNYSKGVKKVERELIKHGVKSVDCKLYTNARHEILNDFCKENVTRDIIGFISSLDKNEFK